MVAAVDVEQCSAQRRGQPVDLEVAVHRLLTDAALRLTVSRGVPTQRGLLPDPNAAPSLVIDATVGPTDQDGAIAGAAKDAGRGIIVAANKWDLMKDKGEDASRIFDENLRYQLKFLDFAPILHISAATGERTPKLLEMVDKVAAATRTRVPTGELNRFFERITTQAPPVTSSKRNVRVMYASQTSVAPPTFVLFTNSQVKLHFSYERFLENRLRESYGFAGSPIRIQVRRRKKSAPHQ